MSEPKPPRLPSTTMNKGPERIIKEVPCAKCEEPVGITASLLEFAAGMNRLRAHKGIPLATESEIALCRFCYTEHKQGLEENTRVQAEQDNCSWKMWLANEITDEQLMARVYQKDLHRSLMYQVKAKRGSAPTKSKGRST